jgi:GAF domain-containing protein
MNDRPMQRGFESNLRKTFENICRYACEELGVEHSGFVRFDHNQETGEVVAQYPKLENLLGQKIQLKGVPAEEKLFKAPNVLMIDDVSAAQDLGEVRTLLTAHDIQSICIVTVKFDGALIGSFSFDSIGKKRKFGPEEIKACTDLAERASSDFGKAQLDDWLESLRHATVAMSVEREGDSLLNDIIKQIEPLFNVQSLGIYLRVPDPSGEDTLRLAACSDPKLIGNRLRKNEGMAWQIIEGNDNYIATPRYDDYRHRSPAYAQTFGSVLEVPLQRRQERIGVIYLSDWPGRQFTEFDFKLLRAFADIAVVALQYCDLASRLKKVSIAITEIFRGFDSENLQARLTHIAVTATNILNAEMCGVFRIDNPQTMVLQASYGHLGKFSPGRQFKLRDEPESGLTGAIAARLIAEHQKYLAMSSSEKAAEEPKLAFNAHGPSLTSDPAVKGVQDATPARTCRSLLAVPLITRSEGEEQVTGMLRISNKKGIDGLSRESISFSSEDELCLRFFADAAALSIETAKLFEDRQRLSNKLATQIEVYQQVLQEAAKHREVYNASKLLSGLELSGILKQLAERTWRVAESLRCHSNIVAIMLFENGRAWVRATYPQNALQTMKAEVENGVDLAPHGKNCGIIGRVYKTHKSEYVNNVKDDPDYREIDPNTKSQMVVLIGKEGSIDEAPVGAISIESPIQDAFNDESLQVFKSALALLAEDLIRNTRQLSALHLAYDREANLRDLALYYVKCGMLFHNQRSDVTAIKLKAEELKEASQSANASPSISELSKNIFSRSESLESLSSDENTRIRWKGMEFAEMVQDWKHRVSLKSGLDNIDIRITCAPEGNKTVLVDQLLLRNVIMIFVNNSARAMQLMDNKIIRIHIDSDTSGFCRIRISDTGNGMDKELWAIISAGRKPDLVDARPRNGLRTALLVITGFKGEIHLLTNGKHQGAEFEIRLPLTE